MAKGTQQQSAKAAAKKRVVKVDTHGDVHVTASFNNIIISLTFGRWIINRKFKWYNNISDLYDS